MDQVVGQALATFRRIDESLGKRSPPVQKGMSSGELEFAD
jgi:hypothetical protein